MTAYTVFPKGGDVQEGSEQWRPKGPQGTQNSQSPGSRETTPPPLLLSFTVSRPCRGGHLSGVTTGLQAPPPPPGRLSPP